MSTAHSDAPSLVEVYTYRCVDGMVRTRCWRHIETRGPYAVLGYRAALVDKRQGRCVACAWEQWQAESDAVAQAQAEKSFTVFIEASLESQDE